MKGGIDCTCRHTIVNDSTCLCPGSCPTCFWEDCCAEAWAAYEERQRIAPETVTE